MAILLRLNSKTGEVRGISQKARSYPNDLPAEERLFYLETDNTKRSAYAAILKSSGSVDKADGAAAVAAIDKLKADEKVRFDVAAKATAAASMNRRNRSD